MEKEVAMSAIIILGGNRPPADSYLVELSYKSCSDNKNDFVGLFGFYEMVRRCVY
jgi:hypothetical protein